jgi:hypothetical protein
MLAKILNYLKIILVGLSVLFVLLYLGDKISLTSLINFSIFLVGLLVVSTILTALLNVGENPKSGLRFGIGLALLVVYYLIGLSMSTDAIHKKTGEVIPGSKVAEAGIYMLYFVLFTALLVGVLSSLKRLKSFF